MLPQTPSSFRLLLPLLLHLPSHIFALPEANALALAEPVAAAEPQTYNYAPFSGAVYIVGGNGLQFSSASPAQCPANAPQGCGNINVWNWCCPASCTCQMLPSSIVGCCPQGSSCGGGVSPAQISTITVTTTATVAAQQIQTVVGVAGGGGGPATTTTTSATKPLVAGNFCQTLYMKGNPIPTTARAACGTVLVLNGGDRLGAGFGRLMGLMRLHFGFFVVGVGVRFRWRF